MKSMNDCPICGVQCIDVCLVPIKMMTADSNYAVQYAKLGTDICDWCAEQCAEQAHEHCQKCAESCRICAEECRKMAA